ncbi:MAG: hypothetical protein P4M11_12110 [Candidatus Pacebacteria bacterium]|nr:hypothetical protein [Candidatus Paceibacterota bacterium]
MLVYAEEHRRGDRLRDLRELLLIDTGTVAQELVDVVDELLLALQSVNVK